MKATRLIRLRTCLLVCTGMGAAIVVGVEAYASAATADRKYTGCLKNGQISAVAVGGSPSAACATASVQITWNETGPAGATGQQGATGARGATGPRGPQGPVEAVNAMKTGVPTLLTDHAGTGFDGQRCRLPPRPQVACW